MYTCVHVYIDNNHCHFWTVPLQNKLSVSGEESEGCLLDCVNDCVAITELRAYKEWDRTTRLLTKSTVHYDTNVAKNILGRRVRVYFYKN